MESVFVCLFACNGKPQTNPRFLPIIFRSFDKTRRQKSAFAERPVEVKGLQLADNKKPPSEPIIMITHREQ